VEARDTLPTVLRAAGWRVDEVACYETCAFGAGGARLDEALQRGEVAAVTLASGSAARALATMIPAARLALARLVSIGPTTTAAAHAAGLVVAAEAPTATMEALADATRRILTGTLSHA
jgi:uroporphyrinogen-III synthase